MAVDAHAAAAGGVIHFHAPGRRREISKWILGVDAALDGVTAEGDFVLREPQRLAHRDEDLLLHEVHAGDFLGDGMLHLNAFVDLQKIIVAFGVRHKLHRAGIHVARLAANSQRGFSHFLPQLRQFSHQRRRRFLDEFLVAALDGAIAFAEVNDIAMRVTQNLKLNVPRILDEFFDVNPAVAKHHFRLAPRGVIAFQQRNFIVRHAQATPTATRHGLDHHGVANLLGHAARRRLVLHHAVAAGRHRHAGAFGQFAAGLFVAKRIHHRRARADERDVATLAHLGKARVFG